MAILKRNATQGHVRRLAFVFDEVHSERAQNPAWGAEWVQGLAVGGLGCSI